MNDAPGPWTEAEIQYLRDNWEAMTNSTIARNIGRSASAVKTKGGNLKLKRLRGNKPVAPRKATKPVSSVTVQRIIPAYRPALDHAGKAAEFLRVYDRVPMYRCDADGKPKPQGDHWRYGNAVLTDDETIAKATRKGWNADAWKALA